MSWKLYDNADPDGELNMDMGPFSLFEGWEQRDELPGPSGAAHSVHNAASAPSLPSAAVPVSGTVTGANGSHVDSMMLYVRAAQRDGPQMFNPYKLHPPGGEANGGVAARDSVSSFVCRVPNCNKTFNQKAHLEIHNRSHTGEKPYRCPYDSCRKSFSQQNNLKTHIRLHTGEKPFVCKVCGKGFGQRGNLTQHSVIHGAQRTFECKLDGCTKRFTQLGNLKTHQNSAHQETVRQFTARLQGGNLPAMSPEELEMFEYFQGLYKNANRGIKGRGKGNKVEKIGPRRPPALGNIHSMHGLSGLPGHLRTQQGLPALQPHAQHAQQLQVPQVPQVPGPGPQGLHGHLHGVHGAQSVQGSHGPHVPSHGPPHGHLHANGPPHGPAHGAYGAHHGSQHGSNHRAAQGQFPSHAALLPQFQLAPQPGVHITGYQRLQAMPKPLAPLDKGWDRP